MPAIVLVVPNRLVAGELAKLPIVCSTDFLQQTQYKPAIPATTVRQTRAAARFKAVAQSKEVWPVLPGADRRQRGGITRAKVVKRGDFGRLIQTSHLSRGSLR